MASGFNVDPMKQFEIVPLLPIHIGGLDASLTNSAVWMLIVLVSASVFFMTATRNPALVPTRLQAASEMIYNFVAQRG